MNPRGIALAWVFWCATALAQPVDAAPAQNPAPEGPSNPAPEGPSNPGPEGPSNPAPNVPAGQAVGLPPGPSVPPPPATPPGPAATPGAASPAPSAAPGEQVVTVYLRGAPQQAKVYLREGVLEQVRMSDPGFGVLATELHGASRRFLPLQIELESASGERSLVYDGIVLLADQRFESVAFQLQAGAALRVPVAPSAGIVAALDQRVTWWVSFGWAAVVFLWLALVGGMWARAR